MEEGRRFENLSWRLWNRETLCCESKPQFPDTPTDETTPRSLSRAKDVPELSASVESVASDDNYEQDAPQRSYSPPVEVVGLTSCQGSIDSLSSRGRGKPTSSQLLQDMVMSIKQSKVTPQGMPRLPASVTEAVPSALAPQLQHPPTASKPRTATEPPAEPTSPRRQSEQRSSQSSTSTAPLSSPESHMGRAQTYDSQTSAELITPNSIVRGFGPNAVSSSQRLQAQAAPSSRPVPAPVPIKSALRSTQAEPAKSQFMLGVSSEDESSLDDKSLQPRQSSLTAALKRSTLGGVKKVTSFKEVVESRTITTGSTHHDEGAIESDEDEDYEDEEDEREDEEGDVSESAIEDEEDSSEWEDSETDSRPASPGDRQMFQRVDSKPNLVSRRSLLTTQLHQSDRANALAHMAQRSQPSLRRSRASLGPAASVATSPSDDDGEDEDEDESALEMGGVTGSSATSRARPILLATPNSHQPALSPRTTRRNMLASELTESLRKHLLWERQQKTTTASAALKRRHTAQDVTSLKHFPSEPDQKLGGYPPAKNTDHGSLNEYIGQGEYHSRGW